MIYYNLFYYFEEQLLFFVVNFNLNCLGYSPLSRKLLTFSLYVFIKLQIERERADLSVQVIQLSERLEEAEGGAESQVSL